MPLYIKYLAKWHATCIVWNMSKVLDDFNHGATKMKKFFAAFGLCAAIFVSAASPASAASFVQATFSGGIFSSAPSVKAPFTSILSPSDAIGGSFVFQTDLVPGNPSPAQNVSTAPYASLIPASALFSINLGSLTLTAANITSGETLQIKYWANGVFGGFAAPVDFNYSGSDYRLDMQGSVFSVVKLVNGAPEPLGSPFVSGYFNSGFTNATAYTPPVVGGAVPEPATWAMMLLGFGAIGFGMRRRRHVNVRFAYAA